MQISQQQQQMKQGSQIDYSKKVYRNPFWAIAFLLNFAVIIGLAIYFGGVKHGFEKGTNQMFNVEGELTKEAQTLMYKFIGVVVAMSFFAGFFGWGYLQLCKAFPKGMIKFSLISVIALKLAAIIAFVVMELWPVAAVTGVFLIIFLIYLFIVRKRIPFAAACLNLSVKCLDQHSGPIFVNLMLSVLQIGVSILFSLLFLSLLDNDAFEKGSAGGGFCMLYVVFSFYWVSTAIRYIGHTTTAGVAAVWYFNPEVKQGATRGSAVRACTTSFGSISFGAFIIAVIETLKQMARSAKNNSKSAGGAIIYCCIECLLAILKDIIDYINSYAFCFVAIYGEDFCTAAKSTWSLLKSKGFDMIINDDLISFVLSVGCLMCSLLIGAGGFVIFWAMSNKPVIAIVCGVICFVLAFVIVSIVLSVIESIVKSFFVCFASDPYVLSSTHPNIYNNVTQTLSRNYPDLNSAYTSSSRI